jgi:hypothetical protein
MNERNAAHSINILLGGLMSAPGVLLFYSSSVMIDSFAPKYPDRTQDPKA